MLRQVKITKWGQKFTAAIANGSPSGTTVDNDVSPGVARFIRVREIRIVTPPEVEAQVFFQMRGDQAQALLVSRQAANTDLTYDLTKIAMEGVEIEAFRLRAVAIATTTAPRTVEMFPKAAVYEEAA